MCFKEPRAGDENSSDGDLSVLGFKHAQREGRIVLKVRTYELSRDEILDLIESKSRSLGHDSSYVFREYLAGTMGDFARLAEVYALCDLLEEDDTAFRAA